MGWGLFARVALGVGLHILSKWLTKNPQDRLQHRSPANREDLSLPRASEGDPVQILYGRRRVESPNLIEMRGFHTDVVQEWNGGNPIVVGHKYFATMSFAVTLLTGPFVRLKRWWVGDKVIWSGDLTTPAQLVQIDEPTWFGGAKYGGGLRGRLVWSNGSFTQNASSILSAEYPDPTLLPNYKGLAYATLGPGSGSLGGFELGENPNLPPFSFEAETRPSALGFSPDANGNVNPMEVLYDVLTNEWGRLGIDASLVDTTNLTTVGTQLENEGNMMSYLASQSRDARETLTDIMDQIDGVLYEDPSTHKIKVALIREDYVVGNLPIFDESNIEEVQDYSQQQWSETYNQVRVIYDDREADYDERPAFAHDMANINSQGKTKTAEIYYPGVTDAALANRLAWRDLRPISVPLTHCRLVCNRDAGELRPGDAFRWQYAAFNNLDLVMRVAAVDHSRLDDGVIVLDCVQDRWAGNNETVFEPPPTPQLPTRPVPIPIETQKVYEMPRWYGQRAVNAQKYAGVEDAEEHRLTYLARRPDADPGALTSAFRAEVADGPDGTLFATDRENAGFEDYATVETVYNKEEGPYDTSTGLRVQSVSDVDQLQTNSVADIEDLGFGVIMVDDEIMAYESFTDEGGGVYTLNNVWRGLLDTARRDHLVGATVWFLQPLGQVGSQQWQDAHVVTHQLITRNAWSLLDPKLAPKNDHAIQRRTKRPYPPADMTVNGGDDEVVLEDENCVDVAWKRRDYKSAKIERSDTADEGQVDDSEFQIDVRDRGSSDNWVTLFADLDAALQDGVPLGAYGWGQAEMRILTDHLPAGEASRLVALQWPLVDIDARHYRQLLCNPTFGVDGGILDMDHWTVNDGQAALTEDEGRRFVGGATNQGRFEMEQVVDVSGYDAEGLTARLGFLVSETASDSDDTIEVTLEALDGMDSSLATSTYGPSDTINLPGADWEVLTLVCPADTAKIKVTVVCDVAGDLDDYPSQVIADLDLRLGSVTTQQLLDEEFDSISNWTTVSGAWSQTFDIDAHASLNHLRHTNNGTAELRQDVTIPTGYEYAAVMLWWWDRFGDSNTGSRARTTIEARDGVGVNQSVNTGELQPADSDWDKRSLYIQELDGDSDTIRVRLEVSTWSSPSRPHWDTMQLLFCQEPAPSYEYALDFGSPPVVSWPDTIPEWDAKFPNTPNPSLGWWLGDSLAGKLGSEPQMQSTGTTKIGLSNARGLNPNSGINPTDVPVWEFSYDGDDVSTVGDEDFASFTNKDTSWTYFHSFRYAETPSPARTGLAGRWNATEGYGWRFEITTGGRARLRVDDASGNSVVIQGSSTMNYHDGAPHGLACGYDAGADEFFVVEETGRITSSAAALDTSWQLLDTKFRIGRARSGGSGTGFRTTPGQLFASFLWDGLAMSQAQFDEIWVYGSDPTSEIDTYTRGGDALAVPYESRPGAGRYAARFAAHQYAFTHRPGLNGGYGLACSPARHNEAPTSSVYDDNFWTNQGLDDDIKNSGVDAEGHTRAREIEGDEGMYLELDTISLGTSALGSVWVMFWARASRESGPFSAWIELRNESDTLIEQDSYTVDDEWNLIAIQFTDWDGSSTNAKLRIYPSDSGTTRFVELSGPLGVIISTEEPVAWPVSIDGTEGDSDAVEVSLSGLANPARLNNEGEIQATGIKPTDATATEALVNLHNGTDNKERRRLETQSGDGLRATHWDDAGSSAQSTAGGASNDWTQEWVARLRWNRAGVREDSGVFAQVRFEGNTTASSDTRVSAPGHDATVVDELDIGHDGGNNHLNGVLSQIKITAREGRA